MQNCILYDWLSFTVKSDDPWLGTRLLGLEGLPWETIKGARGYRSRLYAASISIHFDGAPGMGIWVEMSGQGCRAFESHSTLNGDKWAVLFDQLQRVYAHVTRLDVAYDDHDGLLDIQQILEDQRRNNYVSRSTSWERLESDKGVSIRHGSPQSPILIRIYDKAAERGYTDGRHWVRVEMQLRDERASAFIALGLPIGDAFCGTLANYLRYVVPNDSDSNRWRWELAPYWADLFGDAARISLYSSPGEEYNLYQLDDTVFRLWGNAIDAAIQIHGIEGFQRYLSERPSRPNPKYQRLVTSCCK